MRYSLFFLVVVSMVVVAAPLDNPAVKKELVKFQGAWQAVSIVNIDGKPTPDNDTQHTQLVVEGTTFILRDKIATIHGSFSIDLTRVPKAIDVTLEGVNPGDKILGIYQMEGDLRRSCFAPMGKERPRDFPADGKGYLQFIWRPQSK